MGIESPTLLGRRFRGFLPVVVDLETGGFNSKTDALLEMAAVLLEMNEDGMLSRGETHRFHVQPFPGANMEPASLAVNGIDPHHPMRGNADRCRDASGGIEFGAMALAIVDRQRMRREAAGLHHGEHGG